MMNKYIVEYTILMNVTNKVLWYEYETCNEEELKGIGVKALKLKQKYVNVYAAIKISKEGKRDEKMRIAFPMKGPKTGKGSDIWDEQHSDITGDRRYP